MDTNLESKCAMMLHTQQVLQGREFGAAVTGIRSTQRCCARQQRSNGDGTVRLVDDQPGGIASHATSIAAWLRYSPQPLHLYFRCTTCCTYRACAQNKPVACAKLRVCTARPVQTQLGSHAGCTFVQPVMVQGTVQLTRRHCVRVCCSQIPKC